MSLLFRPRGRYPDRIRRCRNGLLPGLTALALFMSAIPAAGAESCNQSRWLAKYVCEPVVISKVPYATLKQKLTGYVAGKTKQGELIDAGIYFRDLEDGPHFGVNEYANYAAASLLKLPLVVQYLMLAEEDPALLKMSLVVPADIEQYYTVVYRPPEMLVTGALHTVDDLLYRTMVHSDNAAFVMLRQHLINRYGNESFILESYRQLGLVPEVFERDPVITVSRYASMFKLLHSASVLNSGMSEKLLVMMMSPGFDVGLMQGVPADVKVAHKFGEMRREDVIQLHDCGIVYYPDNPYVLCVMTRGRAYRELEKVIGDISRMVYKEVDSRRLPLQRAKHP